MGEKALWNWYLVVSSWQPSSSKVFHASSGRMWEWACIVRMRVILRVYSGHDFLEDLDRMQSLPPLSSITNARYGTPISAIESKNQVLFAALWPPSTPSKPSTDLTSQPSTSHVASSSPFLPSIPHHQQQQPTASSPSSQPPRGSSAHSSAHPP